MEKKKDAAFAASFFFGSAVPFVEPSHARLRASRARDPLLLFFSFFRGGPPQETVRGRAGWVRGGVRR
ncbi:hypothetical protein, partial [Stenotrophomonas lactitubi]